MGKIIKLLLLYVESIIIMIIVNVLKVVSK